MNSKSLRRLAADHGSLHTAGLPPNYLFPPSDASDPGSDLTALDILLAGPVGTPYANGVWRLHLDIPPTYPAAPPTATFRTRLWHPNIDEATGAVCVETLKRDWSSSLKLRDVLVTISCLLIQPNPASALNEAAGKLASEDWEGFCRRAKLMTEIHAAVPSHLLGEVRDAQSRGEEKEVKESESKINGPAKAIAAVPKGQRIHTEDEENSGQNGNQARTAAEQDSDPESDWIPGPIKSPNRLPVGQNNIFGIKGLDDGMLLDTPPKAAISERAQAKLLDDKENTNDSDSSDPFITRASRSCIEQSFSLQVPSSTLPQPTKQVQISKEEVLMPCPKTPFSVIQPNSKVHPLIKEFSWSWTESEILHGASSLADNARKGEVRKRMAGEDFEEKRSWEQKKFKKTGYDLKKYNRGDFGPRTGIGRL